MLTQMNEVATGVAPVTDQTASVPSSGSRVQGAVPSTVLVDALGGQVLSDFAVRSERDGSGSIRSDSCQ